MDAGSVAEFRETLLADLSGDEALLPALPVAITRLRQALRDPKSNAKQIAKIVSTDPALSAHLLRVANSAMYAGSKPVADVGRAAVRLGARAMHDLLMVLVVAQMYNMPTRRLVKPMLTEQWYHSALVATLSSDICREFTSLDRFEATLAGMVHDIGALPILTRWADSPALNRDVDIAHGLVRLLHCEVGEAMLRRWSFPEHLLQVVAEHEDHERVVMDGVDHVDVVLVANLLAHAGTDHPLAEVRWFDVSAVRRLGMSAEDLERLAKEGRGKVGGFRTLLSAG